MPANRQQETEALSAIVYKELIPLNNYKSLEEIFPQSSLKWDSSPATILTTAHWGPKAEDPAKLCPEIWPTETVRS